MNEFRSIKEIIDAFCPDMVYYPATRGNLLLSRCPFCGKKKKAYINPEPKVNRFTCHSGKCGKQLGFMSLYKELSGNVDAKYYDIVAFLDGDQSERKIKGYEPVQPKVHEETRAPLAQRHAVYSRLLELLDLNEDDKSNLMKRGLAEEQIIALKIKSCPSRDQIPQIIQQLESEGLDLKGVPGFYKCYGKYTMMLSDGFFIPYHTLNGSIQGLQIRRKGDEHMTIEKEVSFSDTVDYRIRVKNNNKYPIKVDIIDEIPTGGKVNPQKTTDGYEIDKEKEIKWEVEFKAREEKTILFSLEIGVPHKTEAKIVVKPRYIWFASGTKEGGASSTNYLHFIGELRSIMYLTEGGLKADITYYLCQGKKSFVAATSISSINEIPKVFEHFKKNGVEEIRIVYDMDRIYNKNVLDSISKVEKMAAEAGLKSSVPTWDISMGKGIDDFMLQYIKNKKK